MSPPTALLRVHVAVERQGAAIDVAGEIDLTSAPTLTGVLNGVVDGGATSVTLDLGAVEFMGADGLRIVDQLSHRLARDGDGRLTLRRPSATIVRLLQIFDLDHLVEATLPDDPEPNPDDVALVAEERARRDLQDAALGAIVSTIPLAAGFDSGSVTVRRNGRPVTVASSGPTYERLDVVQYDAGEGPCLAALDTGEVIRIDDVRTDRRWPVFAEAAAAASVESVLSTPLAGADRYVGALNLYAGNPERLGIVPAEIAAAAADAASIVLRSSVTPATTLELRERLAAILDARQTIAHAQGVLSAREGLSVDAAYTLLAQRARNEGTGLPALAADIVRGTAMSADTATSGLPRGPVPRDDEGSDA